MTTMPTVVRKLEHYIIQVPKSISIPPGLTKRTLARHLMLKNGLRFDPARTDLLWIWTGPIYAKRTPHYRQNQFYAYMYHTYRYPEIPEWVLEKRAIFRPTIHPYDVNPYNLELKPRQRDVTKITPPTSTTQDELDLADMLLNYADDPEMLEQLTSVYTQSELDKARLINQLKGL